MIIERNAPLPPRARTGTPGSDMFNQLEVGDCLWVDVPPEYHAKPSVWIGTNRIRHAAYNHGKRTGRKYSVRIVDGRIGCWRVA